MAGNDTHSANSTAAATTTPPTTITSTTAAPPTLTTAAPSTGGTTVTWTPFIHIRHIRVAEVLRPAEPITIRIEVLAASSSTVGLSSLSIGPIHTAASAAAAACAGRSNKPVVVLELASSAAAFVANNESFRGDLAYTMGVEEGRVAFSELRLARGSDFRTVARWDGVKVNVAFEDPTRTSTNRKSSAELAEELATIDPYCRTRSSDTQTGGSGAVGSSSSSGGGGKVISPLSTVRENEVTPTLRAAYFLANDRSCDVAAFRAGLAESVVCNNDGTVATCECYLRHVVASHGVACTREPAVADELLQMCKLLSTCRSADIANVCEDVLASYVRSYWWVWVVFAGAVVVAAVAVVLLWYVAVLRRQPTVTLNAEKGGRW